MVNPDFNRLYSEHIMDLKPAADSSQQYMGKCPFHDDGRPSFAVQMDTGLCVESLIIIFRGFTGRPIIKFRKDNKNEKDIFIIYSGFIIWMFINNKSREIK